MKRKLPLGIQTFRRMREENRYYVDKTSFCWRLVEEGDRYFLSRPRRFGKSLLVDTLKELFEGNEPLFRGLYVHDKWTWSVRYPVVRLSFGSGTFRKPDLVEDAAAAQFEDIAARAGVANPSGSAPVRFRRLLEALCDQAGQRVVVLVDEYDKPILDAIKTPEIAEANRDDLRGLYATIKDADAYVKFAFLTGVSKFSKVSLFSDLNNLTDLTLDATYSAICGYTDGDLDTTFAPELPGLDREEIRPLVQWLQLARRGTDVQPVRHPPTLPQPSVPPVLVRDRHADVPDRDAAAAAGGHPVPGRFAERRRLAVEVRRAGHGAGGAAVPDRLPDDP